MEVIALQSGSSGNCIYVEAAGMRLLFDAGISGRQAEQRLASFGRDIRDVDALVISHDHRDHAHAMGIYQRKYGIPIHVTPDTLSVARRKMSLGTLHEVHYFRSGMTLSLGEVRIETIPTPHDAVDGVGFVVDDGTVRLGILTDLGHVFERLDEVIPELDAVVIESNHDPEMLAQCFYPESLKRRIRSPRGHISNHDAAELLYRSASARLKWACLAHLSGESNTAELALDTHRRVLGQRFPICCADRGAAIDVLAV
jgi:phosphoribosyl 1,2-cyclic phosphodiesterase